jgi:RNA polymerase sigma-70 factor (ECF subfamily)
MLNQNQLQQQDLSVQLVQLLKARDKSGMTLLYEHYAPALFRLLNERLGSKEIAQEALQDVFLKIWSNIDQYDAGKGRFFTWMVRITKNYAIDVLRSKKFKDGRKTDQLPTYVYNDSKLSEEAYVKDSGLQKVLKNLSPDEQKIIDLLYFKGYTHREASKELDIPLGTIKTRTRKAIKVLRSILGEEGLMRFLFL